TASAWPTCPSARVGRCGPTIPTSTPTTTFATPRCPSRLTRRRSSSSPAASSPSAWTARSPCGRSGSCRPWPGGASPSSPRPTTPSWTASPGWTSPPSCSTPPASPPHPPRAPAPPPPPATPWSAQPLPGPAKLLGEALVERSTVPAEMLRGGRALLRRPRQALSQLKEGLTSIGATTLAGINAPAPPSPFNVDIGPHRRYTFLDADLASFKAIKDSLGGTLNDAVLASVSLALGRYLRRHDFDTDGLVLKAMVPVSVRTKSQRGALGNQVAAMWAPLPVGVENPAECLRKIATAMEDLKKSGQAVGAQVL